MKYLDNLNHEIQAGDLVFCLTGSVAKTLSTVTKTGKRANPPFDEKATITLSNGKTLDTVNVIDLVQLGIYPDQISSENIGIDKMDALGHPIQIGDKILFLHKMEYLAETGTVLKLSDQTCLLAIEKNRFNQTEYRQKYKDVINLTAVNLSRINVRISHFSNEDRCVLD